MVGGTGNGNEFVGLTGYACTQVLAGLKFSQQQIQQIFRSRSMRESIVYQEILQEGREEGREEGRQEGEVAIILRLLNRRVGAIPAEVQEQIQRLAIPQLEALGEALLDFATAEDLLHWLEFADR
ncbi:DUF4351 domain-containing protein [Egbenema bharatensis]|uniref:DUF4351 domain-containing protein n=1 Tax=Egbenema bharatensis TaxID=3463334 RepID=UPI003A8473AC